MGQLLMGTNNDHHHSINEGDKIQRALCMHGSKEVKYRFP